MGVPKKPVAYYMLIYSKYFTIPQKPDIREMVLKLLGVKAVNGDDRVG